MLFAELASTLVAPDGLAGLLVPSGIATDDTTKEFFSDLMESKRLVSLYDFENRSKAFEDVDGRFKFSALIFGGKDRKTSKADFVFFAHGVEDTASQQATPYSSHRGRHGVLNPNTKTCPIFRTRRDADLTKSIYKRIPILIDENRKKGGNPWGIKFFRCSTRPTTPSIFIRPRMGEKGLQARRQYLRQAEETGLAALRGQNGAGVRPPGRERSDRGRQLGPPGTKG